MRRTFVLLIGALTVSTAAAQPAITLPDRGEALITTTPAFAFYSDPVFNLHDFLVWSARSGEPAEPAVDCLRGLPEAERAALEQAREHYRVFSTPAGNRLLLALRYRLAGFGDFELADAAEIQTTLALLSEASPAYKACWWPMHDARNRQWVATLEPLLAAHEDLLATRLSELYGSEFRRPFPVDVVSYVGYSGADSVLDPDHLLVSSIAPENSGNAALEIVFHEASHTMFGPGTDGQLWAALEAEEIADGAPLPADFWHAMLFYTTGSAVEARLAEVGIDYEQYLYSEGLFDRSWPAFREPLERLWLPYVEGRVSAADALRQVVAAPKLPDRDEAFVAASRIFVFYSDVVTNLHDFLVEGARSEVDIEPATECLATLTADQRTAFENARRHYANTFADGSGAAILLSMRWRLANFGEINIADPAEIAATAAVLDLAVPAYEACWWPDHNARNRRWVSSLLPLLDANEDVLRARLEELYGRETARWLPVDVVGYAGGNGHSTVLNPHVLLISSRSMSSYDALEALLVELSRTLFGLRAPGALWQELQQASDREGKSVSQDQLELLMRMTTGGAVKMRLTEQGVQGYEPYVYSSGMVEESSPAYREALEQWQRYLDGSVSMEEAVRQFVESLSQESVTARVGPPLLFTTPLPDVPGNHVEVVELSFSPKSGPPSTAENYSGPGHHHPGSVYIYVAEGSVRIGVEGEVTVVGEGGSFFEPPLAHHMFTESASATEGARVIAVMIVPDGAPPVISGKAD